jgi:hypothetical protein
VQLLCSFAGQWGSDSSFPSQSKLNLLYVELFSSSFEVTLVSLSASALVFTIGLTDPPHFPYRFEGRTHVIRVNNPIELFERAQKVLSEIHLGSQKESEVLYRNNGQTAFSGYDTSFSDLFLRHSSISSRVILQCRQWSLQFLRAPFFNGFSCHSAIPFHFAVQILLSSFGNSFSEDLADPVFLFCFTL